MTSGKDQAARRAESLSQQGRIPEAVKVLDSAIRREPWDASLHAHRAALNSHRRAYGAALRDIDRAITLSPHQARLYAQRAEVRLTLEDQRGACRDSERAARLEPGDGRLRLASLRLMIESGKDREASREIARLLRRGGGLALEALFCRGSLKLRRGQRRGACGDFEKIMDAVPADDALSRRSRFYWTVAKTAGPEFLRRHKMTNPASGPPRLFICGLGLFPPYTTTIEVLHAVGGCDVVFNNVSGPEVREFLAQFCRDIRPATYDNKKDELRWLNRIFKELEKGRKVAFVTRGHPMIFGALAAMLVARCRRLGIECQSFSAVSTIDVFLAHAGKALGREFEGVQAYNRPAVERARSLNREHPLLVYFYDPIRKPAIAAFQRALERFYPRAQGCWMFGPKYDAPPAALSIGELSKRYSFFDPSYILYVPPLRG